jgi:hypothetical protein
MFAGDEFRTALVRRSSVDPSVSAAGILEESVSTVTGTFGGTERELVIGPMDILGGGTKDSPSREILEAFAITLTPAGDTVIMGVTPVFEKGNCCPTEAGG